MHSLTKGNHIGELAEWSNAAVLKTVDLNGSGGSNPSLSAKHNEKIASSLLERDFFYCVLHRPAAGGEGCANAVSKSLRVNKSPTAPTKKAARRLPQSYLTTDLVNNHIPSERILDLSSLDSSDVVVELE